MTTETTLTPTVVSVIDKECVFSTYVRSKDRSYRHDCLCVKLIEYLSDGTHRPAIELIEDYKRPFWITNPGYRTHHDSKQWDKESHMTKYMCRQMDLPYRTANLLEHFSSFPKIREVARSPYLYGTDISPSSLLKHSYDSKQNPETRNTAPRRVAVLDLETDVYGKHGDIISGCVSSENDIILAISKIWLSTLPDAERRIRELADEYLEKHFKDRNVNLRIEIVDDQTAVAVTLINFLHEIKPDYVGIWNMVFDIPKIETALLAGGLDPAEVWSDPSVPACYKNYYFKQATLKKTTVTGKTTSSHQCDLWHVLDIPASFYVVDAMCLYKRLRPTEGCLSSYALDYVLSINGFGGKLKTNVGEGYVGLDYHRHMQKNHKVEYGVYNIWDCLSIELMDEKNLDMRKTFPGNAGIGDLSRFASNPKGLVDDMHFFCLDEGHVIASTSDEMVTELDAHVLGMEDWIVTLPSHTVVGMGQKCIAEHPGIRTRLMAFVADCDVSGAYPTEQYCLNISQETTAVEVCQIEGLTEKEQRYAGMCMTGGETNHLELGELIFGFPELPDLLADFKEHQDKKESLHYVHA